MREAEIKNLSLATGNGRSNRIKVQNISEYNT